MQMYGPRTGRQGGWRIGVARQGSPLDLLEIEATGLGDCRASMKWPQAEGHWTSESRLRGIRGPA